MNDTNKSKTQGGYFINPIDKLVDDVLKKEGGYVNHPADKGGPTNYGITLQTLEIYTGRKCTAQDVKNLTAAFAKMIYKRLYYTDPKINLLPDGIQPIIFDTAVNSGPKKAIKMLQEVLLDYGKNIGLVDGVLGNITLKAAREVVNDVGYKKLVNSLVTRRIRFYKSIVDRDPSQQVFLKGWLARAESFEVV